MALGGGLVYSLLMVSILGRHHSSAPGRIRRISIVLLLLIAMSGIGNLVFTNAAYAAKPGQSCTKVGLRSGSYICTKTKGKLIWQVFKKKAQTISVQFPQRVPFALNAFSITYSASSGLKVPSHTLSPTICTVAQNIITPITPGQCLIRLSQSGNALFLSAKTKNVAVLIIGDNQISFNPTNSLLLSTGTYSLTGTSTSGLALTYETLTPETCLVSDSTLSLIKIGLCTVRASQSGSGIYRAATPVDASITIQGTNQISFSLPSSLLLSTKTYSLSGTSTSGLPLTYESLTPDTCSISAAILTLTKLGLCTIGASQSGSSLYPAATPVDASITIQGTNQISFSLPSTLLLSSKTYSLSGTSTSGLPLTYESLTPDTCSISAAILTLTKLGLCTIGASQSGSSLYPAATPVDITITISDTRVTSDQPDVVAGFQIHAIYVVPSDGTDHSYDTNGRITTILDAGNAFLNSQIGLQIPIDKTVSGYDIQFLKSKFSAAAIKSANDLTDTLLTESAAMDIPGTNRKDYIFFIDVPILENGNACGIGAIPGLSAVIAIGDSTGLNGVTCTGKSSNYDEYSALTWPHELIHNFGVTHTLDDPCDLMRGAETPGTCPQGTAITIDKQHTRYLGSSAQGQDILKLRVWAGHTDDPNLQANCFIDPAVPRADGFGYAYCPTGTHAIGSIKWCWSSINSVSLEEFVGGTWRSLGDGSHFSEFWGGSENKGKCTSTDYTSPWKELTVTTPGISLYRWMINGVDSEQFEVIWVR